MILTFQQMDSVSHGENQPGHSKGNQWNSLYVSEKFLVCEALEDYIDVKVCSGMEYLFSGFLEYWMIGKVKKPSNFKCYASAPFRICMQKEAISLTLHFSSFLKVLM
jgi:hypothetical protein